MLRALQQCAGVSDGTMDAWRARLVEGQQPIRDADAADADAADADAATLVEVSQEGQGGVKECKRADGESGQQQGAAAEYPHLLGSRRRQAVDRCNKGRGRVTPVTPAKDPRLVEGSLCGVSPPCAPHCFHIAPPWVGCPWSP